MSANNWNGRKVTSARARLKQTLPTPCYRCGRTITGDPAYDGDTWDVDHITSRSDGGANEVSNYAVSHSTCNRRHGQMLSTKRKAAKASRTAVESERTHKFWRLIEFLSDAMAVPGVTSAFFVSVGSK